MGLLGCQTVLALRHHAYQMKTFANLRLIQRALALYADDHGGAYPSGKTANEALRALFREEILEAANEPGFSAAHSKFRPDGIVGEPPRFDQALEPGENHWMMVDGLRLAPDGPQQTEGHGLPLLFENALDASWPPRWNLQGSGPYRRGRAWYRGKVLIGMNDHSASFEPLTDPKAAASGVKLLDEYDWSKAGIESVRVLDVEE